MNAQFYLRKHDFLQTLTSVDKKWMPAAMDFDHTIHDWLIFKRSGNTKNQIAFDNDEY